MTVNPATISVLMLLAVAGILAESAPAQIAPEQSILYFDFEGGLISQSAADATVELREGLTRNDKGYLEFTTSRQFAQLNDPGAEHLSRSLQKVKSLSVGGWFFPRRQGEQMFVTRGDVTIGSLGERFFRPHEQFINFCLGTDPHGFLLGTIHGNGAMPFVHVTANELLIMTWQQVVVVKDEQGFHHFFQNGQAVHDDRHAMSAPSRQPWNETDAGKKVPLRCGMPAGGLVAELWVLPFALSAESIAADYHAKRTRYQPAPQGEPVEIREMAAQSISENASLDRPRVVASVMKLLGPFPESIAPLDAQVHEVRDCDSYVRQKVSVQVQPGDRMPAYLLIPKTVLKPAARSNDRSHAAAPRAPAIICFYGTTSGAGKQTTVGLSGRKPGEPPHPNLSMALDMVEAGFVALAPDYLRDGERIHPGDVPYDTARFYKQFPTWSIHGKDVWDTMRAVDYLQSLEYVDPERIGMMGHSYGGHSTIFAASLEPRIKAAVANGPVSAFREHGMHWAVPAGGRNSQSLPAMRSFILDPDLQLPVTFAEWTALIAPRPLLVGQAVGERRPLEEQNHAFVRKVYQNQNASTKVRYIWYPGDHDFPPAARAAAVTWFKRWLSHDVSSAR